MPSQSQEQPKSQITQPFGDQLEVQHTVDPPPITETLERVAVAVSLAKAKAKRRHRCRVCRNPICLHYEREYLDTGEKFDLGPEAPDLDRKRR